MTSWRNNGKIGMALLLVFTGCRSVTDYRQQADRAAREDLAAAQQAALGKVEQVEVEAAAETLRKRLIQTQDLPHATAASLGVYSLSQNEYWDPRRHLSAPEGTNGAQEAIGVLRLGLLDALQVGAHNSYEFQQAKEELFRAALDLDLEQDDFRRTFSGVLSGRYDYAGGGDESVQATAGSAALGVSRRFLNGIELSSRIMVDVVQLLTQETASSLGIAADAGISIPLLRGAGRKIVAEPLRQAEKNLLYAVYGFERFKRRFTVGIADNYLNVLQAKQEVVNAEQNYKRLIASSRRSRRLADAGRLPEFQYDQAVQDELRARSRWIAARQRYASSLDRFKTVLGLPPDAALELDAGELDRLQGIIQNVIHGGIDQVLEKEVPPADAPIVLNDEEGDSQGGPLEMDPLRAVKLALDSRLDLLTAAGRVEDAERAVYVAADALRAELTLLGDASIGERRSSAGDAARDDAVIRFDEGSYGALLTLDLPLERTAERNAYRKSILNLQQAVRNYQETEDQVKLDVLNTLRELRQARQELMIQLQAVRLAEKRVRSTDLFLQSGRAQVRDVLESQEALLGAQNALTAAVVSYRLAELALQRDLGVLQVSKEGIWQEYEVPSDTPTDG